MSAERNVQNACGVEASAHGSRGRKARATARTASSSSTVIVRRSRACATGGDSHDWRVSPEPFANGDRWEGSVKVAPADLAADWDEPVTVWTIP